MSANEIRAWLKRNEAFIKMTNVAKAAKVNVNYFAAWRKGKYVFDDHSIARIRDTVGAIKR